MATVQVRYIVTDVDAAIAFYTGHLGFEVVMHPGPGFAMLSRGDLRLVLSVPGGGGGGGSTTSEGETPRPGGWNRFAVDVPDVDATFAKLQEAGVRFRGGVIKGRGGNQAIAEDPSGNPIELFEPITPEARLSPSS